jgi:hypothetical protein
LSGRKFWRQHSIENCILDFYCPNEKLAIELYGQRHFEPEGIIKVQNRDAYLLKNFGIRTLRPAGGHGDSCPRANSWLIRRKRDEVLPAAVFCLRNGDAHLGTQTAFFTFAETFVGAGFTNCSLIA